MLFCIKIVDSTQVKSCRGIWQVFAKRQNSKLFLTLAELQFSNLSKPTCVLHSTVYRTLHLNLKTQFYVSFLNHESWLCSLYILFSMKRSLMDHIFTEGSSQHSLVAHYFNTKCASFQNHYSAQSELDPWKSPTLSSAPSLMFSPLVLFSK